MEGSARQAAVHGLSASAILEVAEGLRWTDPALSVALAEHVARSAGDDAGARHAAERSAVLALGQSDRAAALILRAVPQLRDAERDARATDAAVLRCELALAAVRCAEVDAAEALLEPLAGGQVLPVAVRGDALVAWAAARAARGDVPGVDAAARQVEDLVGTATDDVRRVAVQRSRARARRVAGDATDALAVLRNASIGESGPDGSRESAMLVADQVELLAELGRPDEARAVGESSLAAAPQATTALAVGRVRCVLARLVSLPAGDVDTAARLAREAEADLIARGHEAQAAEAIEVLADVAAQRGESRHALDELRRAHAHATAAREETTRARIALAVALARTEAAPAAGDVAPGRPDAAGDAEPDTDSHAEPDSAPESDPDPDPLADLRASLAAFGAPSGERGDDRGGESTDDAPGGVLLGATPGPVEDLGWAGSTEAGAGEPPTSTPGTGEGSAPEPAPRRRRARYRDDDDPGEALAAALAAAREGGLDAVLAAAAASAAPQTSTSSESEKSAPDPLLGRLPDDSGGDTAEEARSRRLARARARWETNDLLPRRAEPTTGADGGEPVPRERRDTDNPRPSERRSDSALDDRVEPHRHRRDPQAGRAAAGERARDAGLGVFRGTGAETGGRPPASALGDAEDAVGDRSRSGNGHGVVGGGQVMRGADTWSADREGRGRDAHPGTAENGHLAAGRYLAGGGVDGRAGRDDEPVTIAARWGEAVSDAQAAATAGVDDEYRRELALTLVDLLSEYQDAAPPAPAPPTSQLNGRTPGTNGDGRARPPTRGGGTRNGVPSARKADDSGPRLADLLADAMDAYHSAGPGTPAPDEHRARR
ncbi:hypothetical protein [Actinomycetospora flava]|uniref:Tetratricopeptide repeat protein n=1 Tax=Actinomycetospora flava TaxID=3129232 RepID=A0ABU8M205_9PSEU